MGPEIEYIVSALWPVAAAFAASIYFVVQLTCHSLLFFP